MKRKSFIVLGIAAMLAAGNAALADKPSWAGGERHGRGEDRQDEDRRGDERHEGRYEDRYDGRHVEVHIRFGDDARRTIVDYYGVQARGGNCPPGLAKKHNGCLPPGQAKKWQMGRPLPGDLRYYDLPGELLVRLPPPPPQYRYVQVAGDVLLIAVGSSMVVDAVQDILR